MRSAQLGMMGNKNAQRKHPRCPSTFAGIQCNDDEGHLNQYHHNVSKKIEWRDHTSDQGSQGRYRTVR